jgi:competence protein ComEA
MTRDDWVALPGIGDVLADRIEIDRQINGDYGSVDALIRVKGIGKKRLEKWVDFF